MVMRNNDRILKLEKCDPKQNTDLIDPKVFTGGNNLHVVADTSTAMWYFKYEHGHVPPQLRHRFTDFNTAKAHAENYFKTKNIKIVKVID